MKYFQKEKIYLHREEKKNIYYCSEDVGFNSGLVCYVGDINKNIKTFLSYMTFPSKQMDKFYVSFSFT